MAGFEPAIFRLSVECSNQIEPHFHLEIGTGIAPVFTGLQAAT